MRIFLPVGASYDSDSKTVRELLLPGRGEHADVLGEPAPEVIFSDFGDNSLNFDLRVWTENQVQTPTTIKERFVFRDFEACRKAHIELPLPQRDLHIRSVSEPLMAELRRQGRLKECAGGALSVDRGSALCRVR